MVRTRHSVWGRVFLSTFVLVAGACTTVPYTKRSQLMLMPESQEIALGARAYEEVMAKADVERDPRIVAIVRRVGERIARAAGKPDYAWEFTVIKDDDVANAFALPGGKVAVFTGLFPVARDEAGLAAVVGHEVAHVLARHGAERMSQGMLLQIGAIGVSTAAGGASPGTQRAILQAYGLGSQLGVLLPFSRSQESEADRIGMILMAKAGYDPAATLDLWGRMDQYASEKEKGGAPPEFLSTHPAHSTRRMRIRAWLPKARRYLRADPAVTNELLPAIAPEAEKTPAARPRG